MKPELRQSESDPRHGTPDDPRLVLIGVTAHAVEFLQVNRPKPVVLFASPKGWLTGTQPEVGTMHELKEPRRHLPRPQPASHRSTCAVESSAV